MKKDCAFQFASANGEIFFDTELITLDEAKKMFYDNIDKFVEEMKKGNDPEMCIWINMTYDTDYRETSKHWCADDMLIKDRKLYHLVGAI